MQLTLMDLDGVVTPGVVREFDDTVLGLYEGDLVHRVRTVGIAVESIHRLLVVESDDAALLFTGFHAWYVEGWVPTNLEMDFAGVGVVDVPDDANLILVECVADGEGEVVGIDLLGFLRRFEGESHLAGALGDELELGIAGKSVARQVIILPIHAIGLVVDGTDDGEEDGGVTTPILRVCLPQIFLTTGILDALEFCSFLRYDDGELFVLQFYHVILLYR